MDWHLLGAIALLVVVSGCGGAFFLDVWHAFGGATWGARAFSRAEMLRIGWDDRTDGFVQPEDEPATGTMAASTVRPALAWRAMVRRSALADTAVTSGFSALSAPAPAPSRKPAAARPKSAAAAPVAAPRPRSTSSPRPARNRPQPAAMRDWKAISTQFAEEWATTIASFDRNFDQILGSVGA